MDTLSLKFILFHSGQEHTSEQECPVEWTCEATFQPVTAPTQEVSAQRIGHLCVNQHKLSLTIMIDCTCLLPGSSHFHTDHRNSFLIPLGLIYIEQTHTHTYIHIHNRTSYIQIYKYIVTKIQIFKLTAITECDWNTTGLKLNLFCSNKDMEHFRHRTVLVRYYIPCVMWWSYIQLFFLY